MSNYNQIPINIAWYLSGFVDGEGSFNISFRKKDDYKTGWQPVLSFNVSQREKTILALMKHHFKCGIIKARQDGLHSYDVTNPKMLKEFILPFFTKYNFFSQRKKKNFAIFKKAVELMFEKKHLTEAGLKELVELREKINLGAGRTRKYVKKDILSESSETIR
ncbi:MAG: hypothetical protein COZ34_02115 [Candidatus Pacebacteria bacterium CG_4_10_14_3_um_filter_34_15]|nr:MAG: hypothetical protein COV78_00010 [Candidatus Pacebacteria bacterium CG11_big_fil_rev_8_21_14_0_20_34_55]PIX81656.1 MAG: hypothetical protein COZ34_02115 [Candidatus Pacebacteria bacterium CG_4_10_14_3_um_filter_34_15]PJC43529.1 MAG: hypothetical protein CO039_03575 [Candidatus Pacebacteria bacterium CG_4_9_14_0_2_um_filter_34_50]